MMFDFLNTADPYLSTFWYIALPVSLIFLIQMALTFVGAGSDADVDSDFEVDSSVGHIDGIMEYFTIRNMINFLLGFSWGGIFFHATIQNMLMLLVVAFTIGMIFLTLFFYMIQQVKKLEENNSFDISKIVGLEGDVYLRIPDPSEGKGKIQISYNGTVRELDAISDSEAIPTGEKIKVIGVLENNEIIVKHIKLN